MNRNINLISILTTTFSIVITIIIFLVPEYYKYSIITFSLPVIMVTFLILALYIIRSKPTTINISILGFPQSGKTVFLTMLYHFINTSRKIDGITFIPKGRETIETVSDNLNLLQTGKWLPRTSVSNPVFFFRAIAELKRILFSNKFMIEIGDFAGEESQKLSEYEKKWLHKNDYFNYVVTSEVIWLAFDCEILIDDVRTVQAENSFIAALQMVMDEKGVRFGKKMKTPVCLILLKADVNFDYFKDPEIALSRIDNLMSFCQKNIESFTSYLVTSVGTVTNNRLPSKLDPMNVEKPLIWSLVKSKKTTANTRYSQ